MFQTSKDRQVRLSVRLVAVRFVCAFFLAEVFESTTSLPEIGTSLPEAEKASGSLSASGNEVPISGNEVDEIGISDPVYLL
jgi:hypothetical protein